MPLVAAALPARLRSARFSSCPPGFTATTKVELSPAGANSELRAGLVVMGQDYAALQIRPIGSARAVEHVSAQDAMQGGAEATTNVTETAEHSIWLRVTIEPGARCQFSYSTDGLTFNPAGEPFTAREGRWTGAKVGLYCLGGKGHADFDWFSIE